MKVAKPALMGFLLTAFLCSGCGLRDMPAAPAEVSQAIDTLLQNAEQGTWAATYESMTTPEFRKAVSKEEYEKLGRSIHDRLGKLASKSSTSFFVKSMNGVLRVEATYDAQFAQGKGTLRTHLVKTAGEWRFLGFWVGSPQFLEASGAPCPSCGKSCPKDAAFCPACGKKIEQAPTPPPEK